MFADLFLNLNVVLSNDTSFLTKMLILTWLYFSPCRMLTIVLSIKICLCAHETVLLHVHISDGVGRDSNGLVSALLPRFLDERFAGSMSCLQRCQPRRCS